MGVSTRGRRGRGIVAGTALTLLGVQAAMNYGIDTRKLYWADIEYGTTVRNLSERKEEFPDRPIVVVLGTSRARNGFAADRLSEAVPGDAAPPLVLSASLSGASPLHYLLALRRLIAIGIKPAGVVIEILPALLGVDAAGVAGKPELSLDPATDAYRLRAADSALIRAYDGDRTWQWLRNWCEARAAPWYTCRYTLTGRYAATWAPKENVTALNNWRITIGPYGWHRIGMQSVPEATAEAGRKVAAKFYRPRLAFAAADPKYDLLLRDLLRFCRDERIAVLGLVLMPESAVFRGWYPDETARFVREYVDRIAADFGTVRIDASTWVPDEFFLDGHHLIEPGAYRFSDRFRTEVILPWMKSRGPAP